MSELLAHVDKLSNEIGPRPVGTEEEREAAVYINDCLESYGYDVSIDEFTTATGVRWPYGIAYLLAFLSVACSGFVFLFSGLATTFYALSIIFLILSFAIYCTERFKKPVLSKLIERGVSQNVVAKYVPSSLAKDRRRRKIIFVSHVDTPRSYLEAKRGIVNIYPKIRQFEFYALILLLVLLIVRMLPIPWPDVVDIVVWCLSIIIALAFLVLAVFVLAHKFLPYVCGANVNASANAVMLTLAQRIFDPEARAMALHPESAEISNNPSVDLEEISEDFSSDPESAFADSSKFQRVYDDESDYYDAKNEALNLGLVEKESDVSRSDNGFIDDDYEDEFLSKTGDLNLGHSSKGVEEDKEEIADNDFSEDEEGALDQEPQSPSDDVEPEEEPVAHNRNKHKIETKVEPVVLTKEKQAEINNAARIQREEQIQKEKLEEVQAETKNESSLPSWYTSAKARANVKTEDSEESQTAVKRSKFADLPVGGKAEEQIDSDNTDVAEETSIEDNTDNVNQDLEATGEIDIQTSKDEDLADKLDINSDFKDKIDSQFEESENDSEELEKTEQFDKVVADEDEDEDILVEQERSSFELLNEDLDEVDDNPIKPAKDPKASIKSTTKRSGSSGFTQKMEKQKDDALEFLDAESKSKVLAEAQQTSAKPNAGDSKSSKEAISNMKNKFVAGIGK
ncbi:MAG: hypothetical protein MJ189_01055 [Coriobacteriales bacterium]|nr:hypothetical protein [Coriobacteriales bacterium]